VAEQQTVTVDRDALLRYAAYVVWAFGSLAILATYLGVKDKQTLSAQIPYLVSGGLTGVALVTLGAAMIIVGARRPTDDIAELRRKVDDLGELVTLEFGCLHGDVASAARVPPAVPGGTEPGQRLMPITPG